VALVGRSAPRQPDAGADFVIDLSQENLRDQLREQITPVTGGRARIILDPLGGAVFEAAFARSPGAPPRGDRLAAGMGFRLCGPTIFCSRTSRSVGCRSAIPQTPPGPGAAPYAEIFELYRQRRIKPAAATVSHWSAPARRWPGCATANIDGRAVLRLRDD